MSSVTIIDTPTSIRTADAIPKRTPTTSVKKRDITPRRKEKKVYVPIVKLISVTPSLSNSVSV